MQFLLLLTGDGDVPSWPTLTPEEQGALMTRFEAFSTACTDAAGVEILAGEALLPGSAATTIRRSGGERTVSAGPYADAYESLGGFYLIESPDVETLVELSDILPPYDMELRPIDTME